MHTYTYDLLFSEVWDITVGLVAFEYIHIDDSTKL